MDYEKRPLHGGIEKLYKFSNGLSVSAIKNDFSYGNRFGEGLWEIAVFDESGSWKTKDVFLVLMMML